jgi:flavin reductase (DIM6/NTAB) family NADH-FMN oxidoreductase RutF
VLLIGEIERVDYDAEKELEPLVYFDRRFHKIGPALE